MQTRSVHFVALFLALCLCLAPARARGQEGEPAIDNPADTLEQESDLLYQDIDDSKWVFPNAGWQKSDRPDQVFLAFPQEGAHFAMGSVITLGWQPVLEPTLPIAYYEIVITSTDAAWNSIGRTGLVDEGTVSAYLFTPRRAGRYFWTVRAVTEDGLTIPGVGRYLNVID